MKKIITLLLLFISIISFSQTQSVAEKIKDLNDLFSKRKFQKVELLSKEILNNQYGNPTNEDKCNVLSLYTSILIWDEYENKNYKLGYDYLLDLLDLWNNGMDSFSQKESTAIKIKNLIKELEYKHPELRNSKKETASLVEKTINTNTNSITPNNDSNKSVTLTVSGTGKTLEEARLNALRSAIEQAFGAFISSKTEILNDKLIKDEIVSVASGNVEKYDVVSQIEIPNNGFAITLNAIVSISKLTSFAESKGVVVEFKGGMFATNIKLQKLNERSENIALKELYILMHEKFQTIFDYNIESKNPELNEDQTNYNIPITVTAVANNNLKESVNYLINNLKSLSLKESEIQDYVNLKKRVYKVNLSFNNVNYTFYLRYYWSFQWLKQLSDSWGFYLGNYKVENGISSIEGPGSIDFITYEISSRNINTPPFVLARDRDGFPDYTWKDDKFTWVEFSNGLMNFKMITFSNSENELNFRIPAINSTVAKFEWNDVRTLSELEKISNYSVKQNGVVSQFKNGGYVVYEKDGHGIVVCPYFLDTKNKWGGEDKLIDTGEKLFDGKLNTEKISKISEDNIAKDCMKFKVLGYNDWVIPSAEEMKMVLNKLYLTGILVHTGTGSLISSTEYKSNPYRFDNIYSFSPHNYQFELIKKNIKNKDFSLKIISDKIQYDETSKKEVEGEIQPIRYF